MGENLNEELKKELAEALDLMQEIVDDRGVPRNIRNVVEEAKQKIERKEELDVNIGSAIYLLDDVSNDINMPTDTRTDIWTIISLLESVKEKLK